MKDGYMPASLRILSLEFDSCLKHVYYNIEKLSEMLTNEENVHPFEVLNCIVPIITSVCKLVDRPAKHHEDNTFCLQTCLKFCHQKDIGNLESELQSIRENSIYQKLKQARNETVAHINSLYQEYEATQNALLEDAIYLIVECEDRFKNLVKTIESLIHKVEMSIRKKEGQPLNADTFTIEIKVHKNGGYSVLVK